MCHLSSQPFANSDGSLLMTKVDKGQSLSGITKGVESCNWPEAHSVLLYITANSAKTLCGMGFLLFHTSPGIGQPMIGICNSTFKLSLTLV